MGDEGTSRGTTCDVLQDRCVDLGLAGIIKNVTQRADDGGTLQEGILDTLVDHQVDITLVVAELGILKLIVSHTVLILHDRQRFQRLRQQRQFLTVDTDLARLGTEHKALDANEVADVEQLLEHRII